MTKRTFSKIEVKQACYEGKGDVLRSHHTGEWIAEGKYDFREQILTDGEHFYLYGESRTGSPYSEYTYSWEWEDDEIELVEVHEVEKVIKVWEVGRN